MLTVVCNPSHTQSFSQCFCDLTVIKIMFIYGGFDLDTHICSPAMLNIEEKNCEMPCGRPDVKHKHPKIYILYFVTAVCTGGGGINNVSFSKK